MHRMFRLGLGIICIVWLAALAPAVSAAPSANGYVGACTGEYFNNTTVTGSPAHTRTDSSINFFWPENTSPAPGVGTSNYSVRWTCAVNVTTAANYSFNIVTDDGMNVLVDGNLVIWAFYDQGPSAYSGTIYLNTGAHTVTVEYYNRVNAGTAQVYSTLPGGGGPPPGYPDWKGEYFNNQTLSGAPTITRNDASINFNWGYGSPAPSISVDHFSARWSRALYFAANTWRFTTTTDDGVRLWVDGALLIDKWIDQPPATYTADVSLAAGTHNVVMEFYENGNGATAILTYAPVLGIPPPIITGIWVGQYYNNIALAGSPVHVRNDAAINFHWGETTPAAPGVPIDNFSVKWDSWQNLSATDNYTISATSDDGVRVWVDGALVIDGWSDHPPITYVATRYLTAGLHAFHVEFYDRTLGATIIVQIVQGTTPPPPPIISPPIPPPIGAETTVDDLGAGWRSGGNAYSWRAAAAGINNHAFWTFNNTYAAPLYNWARWYPALIAPGNYEVQAYIPGGLATTLNARYWIYHNGRYDLAPRSQAFYNNQWVSLGIYYFHAAGGEYASLSDVTFECFLCRTLVFDAVKFIPR
jgi:hypothetical protein